MNFEERRKAEEAIRKTENNKICKSLTTTGWTDLPSCREYGPKLTKKEWEQTKTQLNTMRREVQRSLWFAQAMDENETRSSLEDSIGWIKQYLEDIMNRMRV